jgi:hypothetical protein
MSDNKRVIKINTELFKIPHATRKNRKPPADGGGGKIKVKSPAKEQNSATLKRKLMKFIRNQHDKKMKEDTEPIPTETFNTEFKESLDYLSKMSKQNVVSNNRTLKSYGPLPKINILSDLPSLTPTPAPTFIPAPIPSNPIPTSTYMPAPAQAPSYIQTSAPQRPAPPLIPSPTFQNPASVTPLIPSPTFQNPVSLPTHIPVPMLQNQAPAPSYIPAPVPAPSYGCLKNGSLPLYRNFHNQTQRINPVAPPLRISDLSNPSSINHIKQMTDRMNEIRSSKPKQKKQKRTVRRTYKIGRSKVFPKVSVLVSNRTIRNHITTKSQLLKQTPIGEVKKYLIKNGFIKVGSIAPNDVLRKMYESATLMCGEVTNHNPEYLLYNFMNNSDH